MFLELTEKYQVSPAKLCLRFAVQNGVIPLPKSSTAERMKENQDLFSFEISKEDMYRLRTMPQSDGRESTRIVRGYTRGLKRKSAIKRVFADKRCLQFFHETGKIKHSCEKKSRCVPKIIFPVYTDVLR